MKSAARDSTAFENLILGWVSGAILGSRNSGIIVREAGQLFFSRFPRIRKRLEAVIYLLK